MVFSNYISVIDFLFNSIVVWEHILCDKYSFKFVKLCFMTQNVVYLGICSVSLRRTFILLLLDEVFYKCQLYPVDLWCCSVQLCPYCFSAGRICQLLIEGCWSLTIIVNSSICPCSSIRFCSTYFGTLLSGVYTLRLVTSSWRISNLIIM